MTLAVPGSERAPVAEVAGARVVLRFGDPEEEYAALRDGAMLVDRSHRQRIQMTGPGAAEALTGLVTNDVLALELGHGCYAAALTAKGKIIADLRILRGEDGLLVDAPARAAAGWLDTVRKYVNPRTAKYADVGAATGDVGIFGAQARHLVSEATGLGASALAVMPAYASVAVTVDGGAVRVARVPDLGVEGYELFGPRESLAALWSRLAEAGAVPAGLEAWEVARVEAGRPEWGLDIDDGTLAQEANMEELHAISYTKGCYLGQETVARVHFRGHVNRHLRGLRLTSDTLPPARTQLMDETGKVVGDVRTAVRSPRLGPIALAMVRREAAPGSTVEVRWEGGEVKGAVVPLPFVA